jgi:DNA-binding NarL/FixJ family response regulator
MQTAISLLLVEEEDLLRDLLRLALAQQDHLAVVGSCGDAKTALAMAASLKPEVAVLDIDSAGSINGIQLGLKLRQLLPNLGIVLLSSHADPQLATSLSDTGFKGWSYLVKRSVEDVVALVRAIEAAAAGFVVLDPQLARRQYLHRDGALSYLTPRQHEILALIAQGFSNATIAEKLSLTEKSVENQINRLYQHLGFDGGRGIFHQRVKATLVHLSGGVSQSGQSGQ